MKRNTCEKGSTERARRASVGEASLIPVDGISANRIQLGSAMPTSGIPLA
jgi:hypothetical protein